MKLKISINTEPIGSFVSWKFHLGVMVLGYFIFGFKSLDSFKLFFLTLQIHIPWMLGASPLILLNKVLRFFVKLKIYITTTLVEFPFISKIKGWFLALFIVGLIVGMVLRYFSVPFLPLWKQPSGCYGLSSVTVIKQW